MIRALLCWLIGIALLGCGALLEVWWLLVLGLLLLVAAMFVAVADEDEAG
jgi:hypothetical protein